MIIYTIFICSHFSAYCTRLMPERIPNVTYFYDKRDCERQLKSMARDAYIVSHIKETFSANGNLMVSDNVWYTCAHRHVSVWH